MRGKWYKEMEWDMTQRKQENERDIIQRKRNCKEHESGRMDTKCYLFLENGENDNSLYFMLISLLYTRCLIS